MLFYIVKFSGIVTCLFVCLLCELLELFFACVALSCMDYCEWKF